MGRTQPGDVETFPGVGFQSMGVDDEVGLGQERLDVWIRGRPDDRLLAGVQEGEERGVLAAQVGGRGRPAAQRIAFRGLDLDDLGAPVEEQLRTIGTRDLTREIENADSGQSLRHRDAFPSLAAAYARRTGSSLGATRIGL
jgi:hypothetical protein